MADVDVGTIYEEVVAAENIGYQIDLNPNIFDAITEADDIAQEVDLNPNIAETIVSAELIGMLIDLNPEIAETITLTESLGKSVGRELSVYDGISLDESVTLAFAVSLYRGMRSVTIKDISIDWALTATYKKFSNVGISLQAIVISPGNDAGGDTFSIKDSGEDGAYLFYGSGIKATQVLNYGGAMCKPFIDYSECTFSTGHSITFIW